MCEYDALDSDVYDRIDFLTVGAIISEFSHWWVWLSIDDLIDIDY